jgi:rare lipoprotein A
MSILFIFTYDMCTFGIVDGVMIRIDPPLVMYRTRWHNLLTFAVCIVLMILLFCVHGCSTFRTRAPKPGEYEYTKRGVASYYDERFNAKKTASGERFNSNLLTAAHRTLPFGTHVVVKNVSNGKSVTVRINDRGPFKRKRIIDLSKAAFAKIEKIGKGIAEVEITAVD